MRSSVPGVSQRPRLLHCTHAAACRRSEVAALLLQRTRRSASVKRAQQPNLGCWSPPGGKLHTDDGESPFACACREAQELGLQIRPGDLHLTGIISEHGYQGNAHWLMFLFEVRPSLKTLLPIIGKETSSSFRVRPWAGSSFRKRIANGFGHGSGGIAVDSLPRTATVTPMDEMSGRWKTVVGRHGNEATVQELLRVACGRDNPSPLAYFANGSSRDFRYALTCTGSTDRLTTATPTSRRT